MRRTCKGGDNCEDADHISGLPTPPTTSRTCSALGTIAPNGPRVEVFPDMMPYRVKFYGNDDASSTTRTRTRRHAPQSRSEGRSSTSRWPRRSRTGPTRRVAAPRRPRASPHDTGGAGRGGSHRGNTARRAVVMVAGRRPRRDPRGAGATTTPRRRLATTTPRPARRLRPRPVAPVAQPRPRPRPPGPRHGRDRRSLRFARPTAAVRLRRLMSAELRRGDLTAPVKRDPHPVSRRPAQSRCYGCPVPHRCNLTLPDCRRDIAQHHRKGPSTRTRVVAPELQKRLQNLHRWKGHRHNSRPTKQAATTSSPVPPSLRQQLARACCKSTHCLVRAAAGCDSGRSASPTRAAPCTLSTGTGRRLRG